MSKQIVATVRFRNDSVRTIENIDRICHEYGISRAATITLLCDRLIEIDKSISNPLIPSPKILTY
jgi:hypothetical protein